MTDRKQPAGHERKRQVSGNTWTVESVDAGVRLDAFLRTDARLGSRGRAAWALERGKVLVNEADVSPADAGRTLRQGDRVRVWLDRPGSARMRLRPAARADGGLAIVYEDDAVLVVNKPPGLLTVPLGRRAEAASVADLLGEYLRARGGRGKGRALVVHRIDRDTSGLVMFARHPAAQQALKAQFERHEPERVYLAVVTGVPSPRQGSWRDWLVWDGEELIQRVGRPGDPNARESRSDYRVIEAWPDVPAALLQVRLVTGKRNQIRVQAQLHGHPLIGERMYTAEAARDRRVAAFPRQALHASRLVCRHPETGRRLVLEAPLPADLAGLLDRLRGAPGGGSAGKGHSPEKKSPDRGPGRNVRRHIDGKE